MELIILERFAELLCTLGATFKNPRLQQIGSSLWDFVQLKAQEVDQKSRSDRAGVGAGKIAIAQKTASGVSNDFSDEEYAAIADREHRLDDILSSDLFAEIIRRASALDPAIGVPREIKVALLPPYSDGKWGVYRKLCQLIPAGLIDTIVCVPWIRVGGADLVACLFTAAVKRLFPDERVIILRLDHFHLERSDWIPEGVDAPDLSNALKSVSDDEAELLLYLLFIGIKPKRIINVNSRRCWNVFQRFGARLASQVPLYGYFFCWDRLPSGARVGYPAQFFATTAPFLNGVFTDTAYLRDELIRIYQIPQALRARLSVLHTPARTSELPPSMAIEKGVETSAERSRPKVLWAGRLDRQKRFDLVISAAEAMPDVDFACWGEALLDATPFKASRLPSNLRLSKNFSSYDELPLTNSDCWLFTSDWEGMPTLLIELAIRGVAIVATAVGGVPELIDETTGWPVPPESDAAMYVRAIRAALADPNGRVVRARELQRRALQNYSQSSYQMQIKKAFSLDKESADNNENSNPYIRGEETTPAKVINS